MLRQADHEIQRSHAIFIHRQPRYQAGLKLGARNRPALNELINCFR